MAVPRAPTILKTTYKRLLGSDESNSPQRLQRRSSSRRGRRTYHSTCRPLLLSLECDRGRYLVSHVLSRPRCERTSYKS